MKSFKRIWLVLSAFLAVNLAWADEPASVNGRFIGGVGLGGAAATSGFSSFYSGGGGGIDGYLGFDVDQNLAFVLAIDSFIFNTSVSSVYNGEVNFAPSVKYAFGDAPTRFYLIGGLGLNDNIAYVQTDSGTATFSQRSFVIEPGAGVQFFLNNALNLYVQAKFVDVFASPEFSYLPITVGLDFK
jgi:hypothetical protein